MLIDIIAIISTIIVINITIMIVVSSRITASNIPEIAMLVVITVIAILIDL